MDQNPRRPFIILVHHSNMRHSPSEVNGDRKAYKRTPVVTGTVFWAETAPGVKRGLYIFVDGPRTDAGALGTHSRPSDCLTTLVTAIAFPFHPIPPRRRHILISLLAPFP